MFTSRNTIVKKTKKNDMTREQFLYSLMQEYESNSNPNDENNIESHDRRLASLSHLANFAYDPINYEIFERLNLVEFFLDLLYLNDANSMEFQFALAGLCNICNFFSKSLMSTQKMTITHTLSLLYLLSQSFCDEETKSDEIKNYLNEEPIRNRVKELKIVYKNVIGGIGSNKLICNLLKLIDEIIVGRKIMDVQQQRSMVSE